ncbi:hypothetical protein [Chryseobacterium indoltheticum]|uniref:hypothetical protein n=1 Tax=Chryseobacterium indoltheticum TaxID=254 RepID=UPI003F497140
MKKYISIFSLLSAFLMISCERLSDLESETQETEIVNEVKNYNNISASARTESSNPDISDLDNLDTGDDDEPRRDKLNIEISSDSTQ